MLTQETFRLDKDCIQVCPNLDILVPALVEGGIDELQKRCALTPGTYCHHRAPPRWLNPCIRLAWLETCLFCSFSCAFCHVGVTFASLCM